MYSKPLIIKEPYEAPLCDTIIYQPQDGFAHSAAGEPAGWGGAL